MQNRGTRVLRVVFMLAMSALSMPLLRGQAQSGEWTIGRSSTPGKVRFTLESSRDQEHSFSSSSDWNVTDLQGLDWSTPGKHDVRFTIARDAGTFQGEGFVKDGEGAGLFTFNPNPQYGHEMEALGFSGVTEERLMGFALHDVSLAFARDIHAAGIDKMSADRLIAFRIHRVTPEFIKDLRDAGLNVTEPEKLIAFRIHRVSPDLVKELARLGYSNPKPEQLIALQIHRVTPEYIEKMRAHGMQNLTLEQLIRLRIHGIE